MLPDGAYYGKSRLGQNCVVNVVITEDTADISVSLVPHEANTAGYFFISSNPSRYSGNILVLSDTIKREGRFSLSASGPNGRQELQIADFGERGHGTYFIVYNLDNKNDLNSIEATCLINPSIKSVRE